MKRAPGAMRTRDQTAQKLMLCVHDSSPTAYPPGGLSDSTLTNAEPEAQPGPGTSAQTIAYTRTMGHAGPAHDVTGCADPEAEGLAAYGYYTRSTSRRASSTRSSR